MFERFTQEARQVVVVAQEEARDLGHEYIGTEHILLGLLRAPPPSPAAEVLATVGVSLPESRAAIVRIVGSSEKPPGGQIPFTPRGKKVLELALREALGLGHDYIGPEHILLGLIREGEGVGLRVLLEFGVHPEEVRRATLDMLPEARPPAPRPPPTATSWGHVGRPVEDAWTDGLASHLAGVGGQIRAELGREPDAGDLLLALACVPGTLVERALRELGVELDELWGRIERARQERREEQAELEREIRDVRSAKDAALESQEFGRAAELRDSERALRARLRNAATVHPDALVEIRRRLGLPGS